MKIWITGGAGSGKSSLAQELASALAAGGPHYYVATMSRYGIWDNRVPMPPHGAHHA